MERRTLTLREVVHRREMLAHLYKERAGSQAGPDVTGTEVPAFVRRGQR